jgi:hypothetical protein
MENLNRPPSRIPVPGDFRLRLGRSDPVLGPGGRAAWGSIVRRTPDQDMPHRATRSVAAGTREVISAGLFGCGLGFGFDFGFGFLTATPG